MVDDYPEHVVHVLVIPQDRPDVRAALPEYRSILSGDEVAREARFYFDEDRERFVIGRAVTRLLLSRFLGGDPRAWRFATNVHGRPELSMPDRARPTLGFNVSHTKGMVACAITGHPEVGVDVERVDRRLTYDVADRFFAAREVAALRSLPEEEQSRTFFDFWTLKEAYIKARGMGLALPLGHFAFTLSPPRPPVIAFDAEIPDEPDSWQFFQAWPSTVHRLAVAVRRPAGARLDMRMDERAPRVGA